MAAVGVDTSYLAHDASLVSCRTDGLLVVCLDYLGACCTCAHRGVVHGRGVGRIVLLEQHSRVVQCLLACVVCAGSGAVFVSFL